MIKFIKKNKLFISSLSILIVAIVFLGGHALKMQSDKPIVLPPIQAEVEPDPIDSEEPNPVIPHYPASVKNFVGAFNEESNTVSLSWSIMRNNSKVEKVELYKGENYIADVTNNTSYEIPISFYDITTGINSFKLLLVLEGEEPVSALATVTVDYVFDIEKKHEYVKNNLGEGLLLSMTYTYNTVTPVGIPAIEVTNSLANPVSIEFIKTEDESLGNGYVRATTYYFVDLVGYGSEIFDCEFRYRFDIVGMIFDYFVEENLLEIEINEENFDRETSEDKEQPDEMEDSNENKNEVEITE